MTEKGKLYKDSVKAEVYYGYKVFQLIGLSYHCRLKKQTPFHDGTNCILI